MLNGGLLVRGSPEFAEHVLASPEEILRLEEDLDSDAGRPYGLDGHSFSVHIDVQKATSFTVTGLTARQT